MHTWALRDDTDAGRTSIWKLGDSFARKSANYSEGAHNHTPNDNVKLLDLSLCMTRARESGSTTMHQYPMKQIPIFKELSSIGFAIVLHPGINVPESKFSNPSISNAALLTSLMLGSHMSVIRNGN